MRAARLYAYRDPAALRVESAPDPQPGPGQVLVRVRAAAVPPTELHSPLADAAAAYAHRAARGKAVLRID
ncbi:MAG: hypothetical protein SF182_18645 [Deltaproteobacteria bacterium]|nr:hypothetical protein [Deltaproteobacteria bacterium]